uniref:Docking protein 2-like n=1 Tax=Acanthochromis polyacanthus TaxID=80966 RepID=A0A3Q1FBH6_9TELE
MNFSTFSFEAGRRCDSGEGSFEFDTKQGNLLFQAVEAAINLQKVSAPLRQTSGGGQVRKPNAPPTVRPAHLYKESPAAQQPQRPPLVGSTNYHAVMANLLDPRPPGADPLYDSIDEMKIRNVFEGVKVEHIYDEPEGCAAATARPFPTGSVYDDPEEMRGDAWRIMGTPADPKGHEFPYNPRADDYAVPKRAHRAFPAAQSTDEEEPEQGAEPEGEGEEQREELQDSPYTNVIVKM